MTLWNPNFGSFQNDKPVHLLINEKDFPVYEKQLIKLSPIAQNSFEQCPTSDRFSITMSANHIQYDIFGNIFANKNIEITFQNYLTLQEFASKLHIESLENLVDYFEIDELIKVETIIHSLGEEIVFFYLENEICFNETKDIQIENNETLQKLINMIPDIGKEMISQMLIDACASRPNKVQYYLKLIHFLHLEEAFIIELFGENVFFFSGFLIW